MNGNDMILDKNFKISKLLLQEAKPWSRSIRDEGEVNTREA